MQALFKISNHFIGLLEILIKVIWRKLSIAEPCIIFANSFSHIEIFLFLGIPGCYVRAAPE